MKDDPTYGSASELGPSFDSLPLPAVVVNRYRYISACNLAFIDFYGEGHIGRRIDEVDLGWRSVLDDVDRIADGRARQTVLTPSSGRATPAAVYRTQLPPINRGNLLAVVVPLPRQHLETACRAETVEHLHGPIVHDLNNLLMVIINAAEVASLSARRQDAKEDLKTIMEAVSHARRLTTRLTALIGGRGEEETVIDVNEVVRSLDHLLRTACGPNIELELELSDSPALVRTVPVRLEQVVLNLVLNARDAMRSGGTIRVITTARPQVHLSVQDDGMGMAPEIRSRVMDPYFTTKPPGKGTGLGLTALRDLINDREVHLDLYSEVGRGTTFDIRFLNSVDAQPVHTAVAADDEGLELLGEEELFGRPAPLDDLDDEYWEDDEPTTYRAAEALDLIFDDDTSSDVWAGEHSTGSGTGY